MVKLRQKAEAEEQGASGSKDANGAHTAVEDLRALVEGKNDACIHT